MRMNSAFGLLTVLVLTVACGGGPTPTRSPLTPLPGTPSPAAPGPTETPEAQRHGIQGLVDDLTDSGVDAQIGDSFVGDPLATQQTIVCANGEDVRVFVYGTPEESVAAARTIDPDDPSHVGTSIVSWDGWPKFWQRDRIIVLYLGRDDGTIDVLTQLMGDPFAQGLDQPQRLPGAC
ncbi:MAG: hypothetical protein ABIP53_05465 [Candidatus Limnocylindrales bacterium]